MLGGNDMAALVRAALAAAVVDFINIQARHLLTAELVNVDAFEKAFAAQLPSVTGAGLQQVIAAVDAATLATGAGTMRRLAAQKQVPISLLTACVNKQAMLGGTDDALTEADVR